MKDSLSDYKNYLSKTKKVSLSTIDAYISDIDKFLYYGATIGASVPAEINADVISKYIKHLKSESLSNSTINRAISSIKSYIKFLSSNGIVSDNVAKALRPINHNNSSPEILEREEVVRLLEAPSGDTVKSKRDRVILELLYATGMKVSELVDLSIDCVNLQFNFIKIMNSGRERTVPIYPAAAKHLSEYIRIYRPAIAEKDSSLLFTNIKGNSLSRQGLWKIIKQYAEQTGINKTITPHTLRHSFAVHLLENGADIKDIKEMMGHSDISSTLFYSNILKTKFNRGYAKYHPLSK